MTIRTALACALILASSPAFSAGMIAGGYSPISASSPEAVLMAKSAVAMKNALPDSKKVRLVAVKKAETQVVVGTNFRLCLSVKDKVHVFRVRTVVYRDLGGALLLTEWTPKGC